MSGQAAEVVAAAFGEHRSIEDFLIHEARLLDERRFEEWRDLFTDDGRYWVPLKPDQQSPDETSLFYDDRKIIVAGLDGIRTREHTDYADGLHRTQVHLPRGN